MAHEIGSPPEDEISYRAGQMEVEGLSPPPASKYVFKMSVEILAEPLGPV